MERNGFLFKTCPFKDEILYYLKDNLLDIGRYQVELRADELGVKYHPNIGTDNLIKRIQLKENSNENHINT